MAPTIEGLRIKLTPFSHHWDKNLRGCHEQDKNKASAPVWIFLSSHTLKGEMHMKRVQCLFLTSQAKGHDSSVHLKDNCKCLIWCSPFMPRDPPPHSSNIVLYVKKVSTTHILGTLQAVLLVVFVDHISYYNINNQASFHAKEPSSFCLLNILFLLGLLSSKNSQLSLPVFLLLWY